MAVEVPGVEVGVASTPATRFGRRRWRRDMITSSIPYIRIYPTYWALTSSVAILRIIKLVGEVCIYIKEIHNMDQSYVSIKLDMDTIQNLHLNINPAKVKHAIIFGSVCMYVCMDKMF